MRYMTDSFYDALLGWLGAPDTFGNNALFDAWSRKEGTSARYNPLATTLNFGRHTQFNSAGVKNYADEATGVEATVRTLVNGYYDNIVEHVRAGRGDLAADEAGELVTWGSHDLPYDGPRGDDAAVLRNPPAPVEPPVSGLPDGAHVLRITSPFMRGDDVTAVQEKLVELGYDVGPAGVDGIYGPDTAAAVYAFQADATAHGWDTCGVDGIVGACTYRALGGWDGAR